MSAETTVSTEAITIALADVKRCRSSPLEGLTALQEEPSPDSTSSGIDSGYASARSTPSKKDSEEDKFSNIVPSRPLGLFQRKVKLKPFDQEIAQSTQDRFADLTELFSEPLYDYLKKARIRHGAISLKLKVLGENEADAKPWIIVQCDEAASKKVKQFFNLQQVKNEYQPRGLGPPSLPFFNILIESRPPRLIARTSDAEIPNIAWWGEAVWREDWGNVAALDTLCGRAIKVMDHLAARTATLGGIIKVVYSDNKYGLYGMTAGHVIAEKQVDLDAVGTISSCNIDEEEDGNDDNKDEDEDEDGNEYVFTSDGAFELDLGDDDYSTMSRDLGRELPQITKPSCPELSSSRPAILPCTLDEKENDNNKEEEDDNDENYCLSADEGFFEFDLGDDDYSIMSRGLDRELPQERKPDYPELSDRYPMLLGSILYTSSGAEKNRQDLDWALFEIDEPKLLHPNLIVFPSTSPGGSDLGLELKEPSEKTMTTGNSQSVYLLSGTDGIKLGVLCASKSFLTLSAGKRLAATYSLSLSKGIGETHQHDLANP